MKVTRTDGNVETELNVPERKAMETASGILEQLAFHHRDAIFGETCARAANAIDAALADKVHDDAATEEPGD